MWPARLHVDVAVVSARLHVDVAVVQQGCMLVWQ